MQYPDTLMSSDAAKLLDAARRELKLTISFCEKIMDDATIIAKQDGEERIAARHMLYVIGLIPRL